MTRGIGGDFRLAGRALLAAPVVAFVAVLTLGVGIGATTTVFSVLNALMLRPLPVKDPQRLGTVTSQTALRFGFQAGAGWSHAMWDQFRPRADTFDGAFAWFVQRLVLTEGGDAPPTSPGAAAGPRRSVRREGGPVEVLFASGGFFTTLGVPASLGRTFTSADDVRGGGPDGPAAVISHDLWRRRFDGAASVVGSRLDLEGVPCTIVGVAPPAFLGVDIGQAFDIALPLETEPLIRGPRSLVDNQRALLLTVMLRLKEGQSIDQATAVLRTLQPQILATMHGAPEFLKEPFTLVPAPTGIADRSRLRQKYERPLLTLAVVSGLVLLIVSVNVANLLLARATARRHELSIRLALGAPRWRLARQLLVEGLTLAAIGAAAGVVFAAWASRILVALLPAPAGPVRLDVPLDWRVLAFALGVTVSTVALFGTAPAFALLAPAESRPGLRTGGLAFRARVAPWEALQEEGRGTVGGRFGPLASGLIVAQVAVSLVLVTAAGLFVRTVGRLASVPLGFEPRGVLVVTVDTARAIVDPAARLAFYERIVDAAVVPGVRRAAGSFWTPLGGGGGGLLTDARGRRVDAARQVAYNFVTPGWFATYGTVMRAGRDFDTRDGAEAPRVAIVNETLRRQLAPDRGVGIGWRIDAGPCGRRGCTVVGVVADAMYGGSLRDGVPPTVYLPLAQSAGLTPPGNTSFRLSVRAAGQVAPLIPGLTAALRNIDRGLTFAFRPLVADVGAALAQERLVAMLAVFFGAIALLLSGLGLYGLTAFAVARRRAEIGIRLALGAQPAGVVRLVLRRVARLVLAGTVVGLGSSLWLSRFVAPLLYGLEPRDPISLLAAVLTLGAAAAIAAWIPASRAARLDPATVLREN